ncbi:G Patch Domain-Containing Protein 1 [Manis pentadactyla]|nr:G Patch Domain-Containing Protein 1 [Manis pentadactyla]
MEGATLAVVDTTWELMWSLKAGDWGMGEFYLLYLKCSQHLWSKMAARLEEKGNKMVEKPEEKENKFEGNALAAAFASSGRANVDISEFGEDRCFCCSLPTTDISLLAATLGINLFDFCFENDLMLAQHEWADDIKARHIKEQPESGMAVPLGLRYRHVQQLSTL